MAQNVTIAGNQYPNVPSVLIPKTGGGGNAVFADPSPVTASASDVLAGKYFLDSTGSITEGTGSGGGDDSATEIIEKTISGVYTNSTATEIGYYVFQSCISITAVSFPVATSIGGYAFNGCTSLAAVSFPLAKSIGNYAFSSCTFLTTASFPAATSIGTYVFYGCIRLTTVSFPLAKSIGNYAFRGCRHLESAYFLGSSIPSLGGSAFNSTPMSASSWIGYWGSIFVKESLLASFQTATNWSTWSARMVGLTDAQIAALG